MITFVLAILSAFGILQFNWWVPFVEGLVAMAVQAGSSVDSGGSGGLGSDLLTNAFLGIALFSCYPLFCGLQVSPWWLFASPFLFLFAFIFPGGITILNLALRHFGLINLPIWMLVIGVLLDAASLLVIGASIFGGKSQKGVNSRK